LNVTDFKDPVFVSETIVVELFLNACKALNTAPDVGALRNNTGDSIRDDERLDLDVLRSDSSVSMDAPWGVRRKFDETIPVLLILPM
jgi:hypothetical protein